MSNIKLKYKEGEVFARWLHDRLIKKNKNVLSVNLGATGSGKSYRDLRMAELWYEYYFQEKFPTDNICFGLEQVMEKISSGKLRRGEILIVEEAGVNLGSLDFQSKVSKMFTYVLQSFRSMNIALFFNLPYFYMLNRQARTLIHCSFESISINPQTKENICKPFFHQVSQTSGKIYKKYPIIHYDGEDMQVRKFTFKMPSKYLTEAYEKLKLRYVVDLTKNFSDHLNKEASKSSKKKERAVKLTEKQERTLGLRDEGKTLKEIAVIMEVDVSVIGRRLQSIKKKENVIS